MWSAHFSARNFQPSGEYTKKSSMKTSVTEGVSELETGLKILAKKEKFISYYFQSVAHTWSMPKAPKSDASVLFYSSTIFKLLHNL